METPNEVRDAIREHEALEALAEDVTTAYARRTVEGPRFEGPRSAFVAGWAAARSRDREQDLTQVHLDNTHLEAAAAALYAQVVAGAARSRPNLQMPTWDQLPPATRAGRVAIMRQAVAQLLPGE